MNNLVRWFRMKVKELLIGTCPAFGSKEDVSVAKLIIMTFNFWSGVSSHQLREQNTKKLLHALFAEF